MPDTYSATILLENASGREALITLSYAPSFQGVLDFASAIHLITTATIIKCTFSQSRDPQLFGSGGEMNDTSFAAQFKLRRTDPNADIRFRSFRLPAPKLEIFEHIQGKGYRVKDLYGDPLAVAYSELMGEEFVFDTGWMVK